MKGYSIYRDNTVIYEFVVDDTISKSLSGNKYVSFTISSKNDLDLKIGDYVLVGNEKYEIFEPIDIEESNGVFTYPLTFYFQGYKLNNSIITDEGATTFAYHGEVSDFMTLLIDSLNEDYPEFTLGTIQNGSILDLSFDNSNCMAALQTVCENAKMEWDITGTIITVKSRIGEETDHVFEYGRNKGSYSVKLAKVANASITTRMIGKGGTLNLPADYVSPDSPKRLNLGNEVLEKNVNKYGKITGVYINENIYPRLINKTVLGVTIPDNIEEAGSWKIKLDIPFNLSDYYADNEVPVVKFQTGDLTGLDFEIVKNSWNNTDKTLSIIVKEEEDGYYLPNANRQPRVGDVFVLLNINMPQSYIDEATQELREATQNELNKKCEPQYAPSLSVQKHYIKKKGILLNIGDGITVKIGGRNITTRIIGTTETSDDIRVELGDQMLYTYDTKVNNTIEQIQFTLKQLINIDDIKRLFYNLINAWYPKWFNQKLHKDADVEFNSVKAAELVQSDNFSSKNFTSGALGSGHRIKDGNAEFQNLTVRGQFSVFEFLIQQVKAIGGKFCVSPAAIKTVSVEETENGYKCFFNTDSGTIMNPFVVGDQAFHQVFDGQKMKRYWRLVTEVGADYFVLSKTDCEANSGIPEADEEIVLLGNRTDINRQSAIMISAYDNNSPYIAFYARINSYSFEGKEPMRTGNLNGIVDEDFGQLTGFGLYCQNVYMKGVFRLMSGKTVEESIGDVQSNLDNLQVGETNLLDNSNKGWKNTGYPIATIYLGDYKPKQGEECTIVIKGKLGANKTNWAVYNSGGNVVLASFYPGGPDTDYIALKTFKWTLGTPAVDNTFIRIYPMPNSVSVESEIEWVKLVLGNKTSLLWTPSINDQRQIAIDEAGKAVDGIQVGGANLLNGTTLDWVDATNASPLYYVDSVYLQQLRGKQITYSGLIKGINAQANTIGLETEITYTDESHVYENIFFGNRGNFEIQVQEHILILDKEIRNIKTYPIFRNGTVSGTIKVKQIQVEIGNKATTWKPSINDQKEIAKQQGIAGGQEAVDKVQIGSQNLISKKMMLKWNEKNKNIAVWGQDADGVYLDVAPGLLYNITTYAHNPIFDIVFKPKTQYVFSVEWKHKNANPDNTGLAFYIEYDDGTRINVFLTKDIKTKTITTFISEAGKTISKIYNGYANGDYNALIYNISLIEGNKPLQGFPVAEEDQTGANNVNLADGTKGPFTVEAGASNAGYKKLYMPIIKPNTVYYVNAKNIEILSGNIHKCDFIFYDKSVRSWLTTSYHHLYDKNGGILITKNDFETQEGYLLCYAGESGYTAGNSVRFTEVMLVEGFLPALVWAPSFSEQQAGIDAANSAANAAQNAVMQVTKSLTELTAENGQIKASVKEVSEKVDKSKKEAIDTAASDATIKANNAKQQAITSAAADATNKADKAKQDAITSAAADATTKADAARNAAKSYTDDRTEPLWKGWIDASKLDESKYYPVVMQIKRGRRARIELNVALDSGTKPSWSTHDLGFTVRCIWESSADGWGTASINRIIEDYHYRHSDVIPAGDINQMTHSSNEYIYVRGGGKYYFAATNLTSEPILKTSAFTVSNQTIDVRTSVTAPTITNATKEELNAEINITKGLIENKVSLDVYNENDQLIKSDISNLQVSYNQISSTVSKIINGTQEISGVVTQSNFVTIFSSNKNALGQEVIESINVGGGGVTIDASRINLNGAISANGNVQITTDGKLIAVNGQFTGKITATEGEIAGLKLSNNGLRSSDFNASSKIGSCYAKNGFSVYASGAGVLTPSIGGMQAGIITAVGDFISHITGLEIIAKETSYNYGSSSKVTALRIQAENRYYGTPFDPPLAIEVVSGDVLFGGKMTVNNTSIFRGQIYLNLNNIPNISGASNYYLCINRSTGRLSYR
jgi:hypothetical protein